MKAIDQEIYRKENNLLAQLPREDQAAVVAVFRRLAGNPLATRVCRLRAKAKATAIERLLGLGPSRKPAKAPRQTKKVEISAKPTRKR